MQWPKGHLCETDAELAAVVDQYEVAEQLVGATGLLEVEADESRCICRKLVERFRKRVELVHMAT